jgi:hypothetical protein
LQNDKNRVNLIIYLSTFNKTDEPKMRDQKIGKDETDGSNKMLLAPPHAQLNEIVYDIFFRVCTEEMEALNKK